MNHVQAAELCFTKQANFLTDLMEKIQSDPVLQQRLLAGAGGALAGTGIGALAGGGTGAGLGALVGGGAGVVSPELIELIKGLFAEQPVGEDFPIGANAPVDFGDHSQRGVGAGVEGGAPMVSNSSPEQFLDPTLGLTPGGALDPQGERAPGLGFEDPRRGYTSNDIRRAGNPS